MSSLGQEDVCHFVSSRGILKSCNQHASGPLISSSPVLREDLLDSVQKFESVYVCSTALPAFVRSHLPRLRVPIVLVSGDSDDSIPDSFPDMCHALLESPLIVKWFAQNCAPPPGQSHTKWQPLPIGLDYHTMMHSHCWGPLSQSPIHQEAEIMAIAGQALHFSKRLPLCYSTFHFQLDRGDRREAVHKLLRELVFYEPEPVTRVESHRRQAQYAFVISPFGAGLDCHRTWEALALGCIPIVRSSAMDPLFDKLPVLIVKDWTDVTSDFLKNAIHVFTERHNNHEFQMEKLTMAYWRKQINAGL